MNAKLKVEVTVRLLETNDFAVSDLRDIVREYLKEGKFSFNEISFIANYKDEVANQNENRI